MRILIVGGGLGGLLLAHRLVKENDPELQVVILERDESPQARDQGIVIGLRQEGVDAIVEAGQGQILETLMNVNGGSRGVAIRNHNGTVLIKGKNWLQVKLPNKQTASSLVPRSTLRVELAAALPDGIIRWNAKVVTATDDVVSSKVRVELESGEIIEGDVLIGADGARSRVRQQFFPNLEPNYLGLYSTWGTIASKNFGAFGVKNELLEQSKESLIRTNGGLGCSMLSFVYHPKIEADDKVFFWSLSMPNEVAKDIKDNTTLSKEDLRRALCAIAKKAFNESSKIELLIRISDTVVPGYELTSVEPSIYSSGKLQIQNVETRVTLLGDAAHKTTTQAGIGATAAFLDAINLATTLIDHKHSFTPSVLRAYEMEMCKRATMFVQMSLGNTKRIHKVNGPIGLITATCLMWIVGNIIGTLEFFKS